MKLFAISDLHVGYPDNREVLEAIEPHPDDWLIVAGDVGEKLDHLVYAWSVLGQRFAQLIWVPGNHELWTLPSDRSEARGVARYEELVAICRGHGVLTPEDPFPRWDGEGGPAMIAPVFTLYDYSFRPPEISEAGALPWAAESNLLCVDEKYLPCDPFESKIAWCHDRCRVSEARLDALDLTVPTVLVGHFPLREELVFLPRIPRFSIWCGTKLTEDWPRRYRAEVVVSGHLHIRSTRFLGGVRYEEVSLGYPKQWRRWGDRPLLRQILPEPSEFPYDWRQHFADKA